MHLLMTAMLLIAATQENEAEKLFRAMEAKLAKAKTVQLAFQADITEGNGKKDKMQLRGTFAIAEDNKFHMETIAVVDGKEAKQRRFPTVREW